MSGILDKHPAPWRFVCDGVHFDILDPNEKMIGEFIFRVAYEDIDEAKRIIAAAPELLAALKALVHNEEIDAGGARLPSPAALFGRALIERIEKGGGT